jgi:hypothetical protein
MLHNKKISLGVAAGFLRDMPINKKTEMWLLPQEWVLP